MKLSEAILEIGHETNPAEAVDALEGKVDKSELLRLRLENSRFYFEQGIHLLGSPALSSEMFYQSIVEGLKSLRDYFGLQKDLRACVIKLSDILGNWISEIWDLAVKLHYDGYILEVLEKDDLEQYIPKIKEFIENCHIVINS